MDKKKKAKRQITAVVIILVLSVLIAKVIIATKKPPEKKPQKVVAPLLHAIPVLAESMQMTVQGLGEVRPRMQVQVVPQVSGKIIELNPDFINGGFFKANEPLVVVEQADYKLAVESADAAVAHAQVQLEQEKAEADVAKKEWEKLHPGQQPESVLVFRGPQIRNAQAQLNAAKAQLAKAKLDLERTTIRMPFDGRVVSTNIDLGQFITTGAPIGTVYRTDLVEIIVPLEDSELEWFAVPMNGNGNPESEALVDVVGEFAGQEHHWSGRLVRTEGQIDPRSRMVHVVVEVKDPFKTISSDVPLIPGMFVRINIQGKQVSNIYRVPRYAVRGTHEVWVAHKMPQQENTEIMPESDGLTQEESSEGQPEAAEAVQYQLKIQPVTIVRMDKQSAYITDGLQDSDVVITSPLETVTDGMTVRIYTTDEALQSQGE